VTTRHLVDPEIAPMIDLFGTIDLAARPLEQVRAESEARFAFLPPPAMAGEPRTIEGPDGPLEVYWYDPAPGAKKRPALLHIHGGGMVMGSAATMKHGPAGFAAALGIPVASVEYRLAPEHPFPAPQEDCYAALAWLAGHADELGIDSARIGVIGESAGGGLAAALAQMARDRKGPPVAAQFLIYPMLDHRTGSEECPWNNAGVGEFIWTRAANRFGWEALQGSYAPTDHRKGWFSPALADDLAGLPRCWIGTGSLDLFLDEDLDYARRLIAAGVPVELHCYPGGIHAFNAVVEAGIAKAFTRDLLGAIAAWL
jgi:acetyl esterase/lipase